ncbi:hypothetical protein SGFS_051610 [Streptomyces graminofaciens]|uniref:Helix-turn-helix domain-containing protein n=1 Tax=Streptomyces graminofaciens TaxID=68212 RepID=A0ABM7FC32_9ACTN|nr:helix-turn-helix domain-containing protein [Streptomyces graminofaciens]BBC33867.1 hypothetical protein SGFS_051610 [Streptomyces graminofaciens]
MDTQHPSAPSRARSRVAGNNHPHRRPHSGHSGGGLIHDHTRHTTRFTVVGNHLAQHPELSGLAIGLGVHIQSLPQNSHVDIRTLADRFPESRARVAAALRELETHGYLRREHVRTPNGQIITRTTSCNQPGRRAEADVETEPSADPVRPAPAPTPTPTPTPTHPPAPKKRERVPRKPLPPVPQPAYPSPTLLRTATDLLADLRHRDPRLFLSACDTNHLAPGVAAWLQRDVGPTAVRHALTTDLPPEGLPTSTGPCGTSFSRWTTPSPASSRSPRKGSSTT